MARKFGITHPEEWEHITWEVLLENGAGAIYNKYRGSLLDALKDAYEGKSLSYSLNKGIKWNEEWFRKRGYWKDRENQQKMIERIAHLLKISKPSDWGQVTIQMVIEKGGNSLFKQLGYSLFGILKKLYPSAVLILYDLFSRYRMEERVVSKYI